MSLRQQVLAGGTYLIVRQGLGFVLNLAGVIVLTRVIGPSDYGSYILALSAVVFLATFARLGIDSYLVRAPDVKGPLPYQQALLLLLVLGALTSLLGLLTLPMIITWTGNERSATPLIILLPTIVPAFVSLPSTSMIERRLDYRSIAMIELAAQTGYLLIALTLAIMGFGLFALLWAYWTQTIVACVFSWRLAPIRPKLVVSVPLIHDMLRYGIGFSTSSLVWSARPFVISLLLARYTGTTGVAYANLATRLVEAMTLMKRVTWRLALAALAKIQSDNDRLQRVLSEAMTLQVLITGPFLVLAGLTAPWLLPRFIGTEWDATWAVYPFVALGAMVNAAFSMEAVVLNVRGQNWWVGLFHAAHIALLASSLIILLPRLGVIGYGYAEIAAIGSYLILDKAISRSFSVSYRAVFPWLLAFSLPAFAVFAPGWGKALLVAAGIAIVIAPRQSRQLKDYIGIVRDATGPRIFGRSPA